MLKASVTICTYNRADLLLKCLTSIVAQQFSPAEFEIIIIDNNSQDDTAILCQNFIASHKEFLIKYFLEKNQGVSFTRNRCVAESQGEIICFIDDDCIAEKNWLQSIVSFYEENKNAYSTGGKIKPLFINPPPHWYGKYFWGLVGNFDLGKNIFQMKGARYPCGANMHFRKLAFEKYGAFDNSLGRKGTGLLAGEEKAMYKKLLYHNQKVFYLPHVLVHHHVEEKKYNKLYVKQHSIGIGASEKIMNKEYNIRLLKKLLEYIAKFGYAVCYSFLYFLQGQWDKGWMLIKFRWWVIAGFVRGK